MNWLIRLFSSDKKRNVKETPIPTPKKHPNGMPFYGTVPSCVKCGQLTGAFVLRYPAPYDANAKRHAKVQYIPKGDREKPTYAIIKRTCSCCGYIWHEMPLDEMENDK